jgi:hypothetical protein
MLAESQIRRQRYSKAWESFQVEGSCRRIDSIDTCAVCCPGVRRGDKGFIIDTVSLEASAEDDAEALKIFADYMLAESQIRRQRYSKAWDSYSTTQTPVALLDFAGYLALAGA